MGVRSRRVVLDNLSTHTAGALYETFPAPEAHRILQRIEFHYTPKHASWLNMAEIEVSLFSRECLGTRRLADLATLRREAKAWTKRANRERRTIQWRFTRKRARQVFQYEPVKKARSQH
jgi:hypothetical protein